MAISLSNHEDRIKALESQSNHGNVILGGYICYTRWFHTTTLKIPSRAIRRIFIHSKSDADGPQYTQIYDSLNMTETVTICDGENVVTFVRDNGEFKEYMVTGSGDWFNNILQVYYALKLYYNFSYNIYSLLKVISNHTLSLLRGDTYGITK